MESWILDGSSQRLPVSVLTGFLGSGKTTVLDHLIQQPALSRTLVLINEFGEIGLDHDLVTHSKDDVVIEMSSGCLCCTIRGDLAETLREAPGRFARGGELWFDRVVIETTGLADPAPILHILMTEPAVARRYRLDGGISTVDAVNGDDTLDCQIESVKQAWPRRRDWRPARRIARGHRDFRRGRWRLPARRLLRQPGNGAPAPDQPPHLA